MLFQSTFGAVVTAVANIGRLGELPAFHLKIILTKKVAPGTEVAVFAGIYGLVAQAGQ